MASFDPEHHGFLRVVDCAPGGVTMFEYSNHPVIDGKVDVFRINLYLSRDGTFVTVWNGLIEPKMTEAMFQLDVPPDLLRFQEPTASRRFADTSRPTPKPL